MASAKRVRAVFKMFISDAFEKRMYEEFKQMENIELLWNKISDIIDEFDSTMGQVDEYYKIRAANESEDDENS